MSAEIRAGFCAILGLPNVGKSTFLNEVLGVRIAAVSPKPQTTRNKILGVKNTDGAQLVFVDTPGIQGGRNALRRFMREESLGAAGECDAALLIVDVSDRKQRAPGELAEGPASALAEALAVVSVPVILALNKIDRLADKQELLPIIEGYSAGDRFASIVPICARRGDGLEQVCQEVAALLPVGPRLFPEEMYTDRAERFLAAEFVREQLFLQLGEELPYATAVLVEEFVERKDRGDVVISATIHVERDSQKGIVVGKGGARVKEVGQKARAEIAKTLGCPVHLKLFVKVSPAWSRGEQSIRKMGYE